LVETHLKVLFDCEAGEDVVGLWDEANAASDELVCLESRDVVTVEGNAPTANVDKSEDCLEEGGFSGTVRSDDANEFTLVGIKVGSVKDVDSWQVAGEEVFCLDYGNF
jgi:hypothetical protein